ncbi:hypothetical protein DdX_12414 [Ditylenchus destructor]|uniref:Secreted protein n=1 Tax=Ditylenchus destructor TaxID=166010 RepID=A0AAD4MZ13_9BILA|nr:hypothetical protein DdX_12414 [Ditylenchus destructor]
MGKDWHMEAIAALLKLILMGVWVTGNGNANGRLGNTVTGGGIAIGIQQNGGKKKTSSLAHSREDCCPLTFSLDPTWPLYMETRRAQQRIWADVLSRIWGYLDSIRAILV